MEFKASLDNLSKVITTAVIIIFIILGAVSVKILYDAQGDMTTILIHSGALFFLTTTILLCYLLSPQKYLVNKTELIIEMPIRKKRIAFADIVETRLIEKGEMSGTIRTFGVGGLFGYFGLYYNRTFGAMTLYATQRKNRILIRTKQGAKIVISPDDIDMVNQLKPV